ncbi:MAG: glutamine--fructose-6-phosphate transaminase (isomerizing) [Candidatus Omnitrophica bacterium]|nr:glutamine--fructose-6-phosphate transaminase (isomerizing) [Candidatus Omnitrophota bacterium]
MCGIFGFKGKGNVREIIKNGLKTLEYRGYDSCGFFLNNKNFTLFDKKVGKGKIDELVLSLPFKIEEEVIVLSHTRWATHGQISEDNAHPHFDCKKEIVIVHNGTIENYQFLKRDLEKKKHKFISQTDTEVLAHLIEENLKKDKNIFFAVISALKEIEGSFAFLITKKGENLIIGAKKNLPLVIGFDGDNYYFSSDPIPIAKYTNKILFLQDDEIFCLDSKIKFYNFKKNIQIKKEFDEIDLKEYKITKGIFDAYMIKEIYEQPEAIEKTLKYFLDETFERLLKQPMPERIIITGCGTSWHAGLIGEYMIEKIIRIPVEVEYASELRYKSPVVDENTLLIAISQSGETADTLGAIKKLKGKCRIFSICNVEKSSIVRESDFTLLTKAGPEIGVASTKSFTSQILILYLFSLTYLFKKRKIDREKFNDICNEILKITEKISFFLNNNNVEKIAEKLIYKTNALYLGRGINFPIALEGALKLKEVSYIHAEGYPAAEMKHGPIALIDENMPVIFICVKDKLMKKVLINMEEVKTRKGFIISVCDFISEDIKKLSDDIILIPHVSNEYMKPFLTVIPLQLLSYYVANKKGIDVDKPRNLAKSVTVE